MESARKRKHSPVSFDETAATSLPTETGPDSQVPTRQDAGTVKELRSPSMDTSIEFACCICLDTVGRKQMKRLPCSHVFHQSCVDKWLNNSQKLSPLSSS
ncbi:Receptor homology region like protein [Argiope bruennichi]|uniref:Receptor homology region like protein n=1 Tax=Argiope bruennichi TaxID=94029 RepID=A0A8T0EZQ0_ARGBR|nr:Receptor homology region like protein [Argiope bruennichi]